MRPFSELLSRRLMITNLAVVLVGQLGAPLIALAETPYARATDESDVRFDAREPLGLKLSQINVYVDPSKRIEGSSRVIVVDVLPEGQAAVKNVQLDTIVVAVDGINVEKDSVLAVQNKIDESLSKGGVTLTLKDPNRFQYALIDPPPHGATESYVSTALTPSSDAQSSQILAVQRQDVPPGGCRRPASEGDLVEISYEGRVAETGALFDGMDLALRQGDSTIQFVLGRQPAGQFPPSWDVGLVGMCIGETRTLYVPPVLGFGSKGLPKRGVPPNAGLQYRVELVSINGLAMD